MGSNHPKDEVRHLVDRISGLAVKIADELEARKVPATARHIEFGALGELEPVSRAKALQILGHRRRTVFSGSDLFGDPAWEILLHLFVMAFEGGKPSISKVSRSARIAQTTALRHIDKLSGAGLIEVHPDIHDARLRRVTLSPVGLDMMTRTLTAES